jgi:hypothetical protein
VPQHGVRGPLGPGAELRGGHRRDVRRDSRELERVPGEVVPARLAAARQVIERVGRLREHGPHLARQVERVARPQHLIGHDAEGLTLSRQA